MCSVLTTFHMIVTIMAIFPHDLCWWVKNLGTYSTLQIKLPPKIMKIFIVLFLISTLLLECNTIKNKPCDSCNEMMIGLKLHMCVSTKITVHFKPPPTY